MKVTDLTLFAPDVTSISIACLILKELTDTCNSRRKPVDYGA